MLQALYKKERKQVNSSEKMTDSTGTDESKFGLCQIYSSGPKMSESAFYKKMLKEIKGSKKHIYIDHMYSHPTDELKEALAKKVNEGVKIAIVTRSDHEINFVMKSPEFAQ